MAVKPALRMAKRQAGIHERLFEGVGAPDGERHKVVPPQIRYLRPILDEFAVAEHPITRQVGPDIQVSAKARHQGLADLGDLEKRTWLRVTETVHQKIQGIVFR